MELMWTQPSTGYRHTTQTKGVPPHRYVASRDEEWFSIHQRTHPFKALYKACIRRAFAEHDQTDLPILDSVMSRMNGREVYDTISRLKADIEVLFTGAYTSGVVSAKGVKMASSISSRSRYHPMPLCAGSKTCSADEQAITSRRACTCQTDGSPVFSRTIGAIMRMSCLVRMVVPSRFRW
jgi:CheY-like chemotaxis protein